MASTGYNSSVHTAFVAYCVYEEDRVSIVNAYSLPQAWHASDVWVITPHLASLQPWMNMQVAPTEVVAEPAHDEAYLSWRLETDLRAPYWVAPEFLRGTKKDADYERVHTPLIVFINARSGGRVGPTLAARLSRALGRAQVFDVAYDRPDKVLHRIYANLADEEARGNTQAAQTRRRMRILACGGDGTVAWVMKVVKQLDLQPQPPIAIMPLGTGNDLSRTFDWGPEFVWKWISGHKAIYNTLHRVARADVADLDCWRVQLELPGEEFRITDTCHAVSETPGSTPDRVMLEGMFWNYLSVGADAQAAYRFHRLREHSPHLASSRLLNQFWYAHFSATSGWFCGGVPSVERFSHVELLKEGSWVPLVVPPEVKAIVLVNLQSYGGGRNIWGPKMTAKSVEKHGWKEPLPNDNMLEVVGFTNGFRAAVVMASYAALVHGKRLAQARGVRIRLADPARPDAEPGQVFMQVDGEPWQQKVPSSKDRAVVLTITHAGVSKLLNNTHSEAHPVPKKATRMLSSKQQQAYLHPSTPESNGQGFTEVELS